ncbi:hypothetical protein HMPREF9446_02712 [Bacteroides fluxus YIT 12057]|uniref:Uncharacterized protein n=1 Tax=Bacteroides fluxus YIT 12057 TaxID=763034 RepID=F3PVD4_9BACE|nr:hypothetical protein HMPREF9446_02712 [Bacteroides fluxus YIT 12057]
MGILGYLLNINRIIIRVFCVFLHIYHGFMQKGCGISAKRLRHFTKM